MSEIKKYLYHKDHAPKCFEESKFEFAKKNGYMTVQEFRALKDKKEDVKESKKEGGKKIKKERNKTKGD